MNIRNRIPLCYRATKLLHLLSVIAPIWIFVGCANLTAIRDFAAESKSLSAYSAIPADFVGSNVRMQALYGKVESSEELDPFKDHQRRFEESQAALVKYMGALAAVADNGVIDYKKNVSDAASAATNAGVLEKADADLFSSALNFVARLATDAARRKLLREMITRCDPSVQKLTETLAETVSADYLGYLNSEGAAAQSMLMDTKSAGNNGLTRLAQYTLRDHAIDLEVRRKSAAAYAKALRKIAEGHSKLSEHVGDFTAKELIAEIKGYETELKDLKTQLKN